MKSKCFIAYSYNDLPKEISRSECAEIIRDFRHMVNKCPHEVRSIDVEPYYYALTASVGFGSWTIYLFTKGVVRYDFR